MDNQQRRFLSKKIFLYVIIILKGSDNMKYKQICKYCKDIKEYYYITEEGKIYSTKMNDFMKQRNKKGTDYKIINLMKTNGKKKTFRINRLMMLCFCPIDNPEKMEVNHIDGDKSNNKLQNLEWCTSSENQKHAFKNGLQKARKGENSNFSKLSEKEVVEIRKIYSTQKITQKELANKFNTTKSNISAIVNYKSWKEITFND